MDKAETICGLPEVITAGVAMKYFGMEGSEFDYIVENKALPFFETEYNRFYVTRALVWAINEFIAESAEFNSQVPEQAFPVFIEKYKTMFRITKPKERERLRAIESVSRTFDGEFADYAKSVVFGWQRDLCPLTQKRFLLVLQKLDWLTQTGEKRLKVLEESHPE